MGIIQLYEWTQHKIPNFKTVPFSQLKNPSKRTKQRNLGEIQQ